MLDPKPSEKSDPDPKKNNQDPQRWFKPKLLFYFMRRVKIKLTLLSPHTFYLPTTHLMAMVCSIRSKMTMKFHLEQKFAMKLNF
jgi:hypothetical protein